MGGTAPKPLDERRVLFVGLPGANPCGICLRVANPDSPFARDFAEGMPTNGSGIISTTIKRHYVLLTMWKVPSEIEMAAVWNHFYEAMDTMILVVPCATDSSEHIDEATQANFAQRWEAVQADPEWSTLHNKQIIMVYDTELVASDVDVEPRVEIRAPNPLRVNAVTGDGIDEMVDKIMSGESAMHAL